METATSSEDPSYETLKKNFATWITDQVNDKKASEEQIPMDVVDVVHLLEMIGFSIHKMERPPAGYITPSSNKGIRITIECTNSKQECKLERPLDKENCTCKKRFETSDEMGKILTPLFAAPRPITDFNHYSEFIPTVSTQMTQTVSEIMTYLVGMLREVATLSASNQKQFGNLTDAMKKLELVRGEVQVLFSNKKDGSEPQVFIQKASVSPESENKFQSDSTVTTSKDVNLPEPACRSFLYSISPLSSDYVLVNDSVSSEDNKYVEEAESLSGPMALVEQNPPNRNDNPIFHTDSQSLLEEELKEALEL